MLLKLSLGVLDNKQKITFNFPSPQVHIVGPFMCNPELSGPAWTCRFSVESDIITQGKHHTITTFKWFLEQMEGYSVMMTKRQTQWCLNCWQFGQIKKKRAHFNSHHYRSCFIDFCLTQQPNDRGAESSIKRIIVPNWGFLTRFIYSQRLIFTQCSWQHNRFPLGRNKASTFIVAAQMETLYYKLLKCLLVITLNEFKRFEKKKVWIKSNSSNKEI